MEHTTIIDDTVVVEFPFLDSSNKKDLLLLDHLEEKKPWEVEKGKTLVESFAVFTLHLRNVKDSHGTLIFDDAPVTTIQNRFNSYMKLAATWKTESQNKKTGADDDKVPCSAIQQRIMSIHELHQDYKQTKKNSQVSAKKIKNRKMAAGIIEAAVRNHTSILSCKKPKSSDDVESISSSLDEDEDMHEVSTAKTKSKIRSSSPNGPDAIMAFMGTATNLMGERAAAKIAMQKEKEKKRKMMEATTRAKEAENRPKELQLQHDKEKENQLSQEQKLMAIVAKVMKEALSNVVPSPLTPDPGHINNNNN